MTTPQSGIFALGTRCQHHLEFDLRAPVALGPVTAALAALAEPHVTGGAANLVLGFGPDLWARLCPGEERPEGLAPFGEVEGRDGHRAPATQHDVWVWIHGAGTDTVLDAAAAVADTLAPVAVLVEECPCFVYHDSRDLTGFIDGTATPGPAEAPAVACIPSGRPGAGGSHVLAQRWVHDLSAFAELAVVDQERVIGRTKLDSIALPAGSRPADAHISLAEIHDAEGNERPIYRRSAPYGSVAERGLYFVAFSGERDRFDAMLAQMFGTDGRDQRDRLLDFSTAVTGSYYFAPSAEDLAAIGTAITPGAA